MKRALAVTMAILLLAATGWAAEKAKVKEVTITGKISCTFCNLAAQSNCTKECCQACLKSGDPVLLSDAKGNLYILLNGEKEKPLMTADRMNLVTEKVKVQGMLVKRGGVQGIYVKNMEKAK